MPRSAARGPLMLDPATAVLHYAQEIFEGLKAYRAARWRRRRCSVRGECAPLPRIRRERHGDARTARGRCSSSSIEALVKADRDWIPDVEGGSLYLRPFMFASEVFLGVKPAAEYQLPRHRIAGGQLFQVRRAGGLDLGSRGLHPRRARRHRRGQVRRQLCREPGRAGRGDRARAATRSCSSTRPSAAGSRNWAA